MSDTDLMLDPNVLTIGFARRFATYKRVTLLLSDPDRLKRLLSDQHRPVQLIVAGKAHPNDMMGKSLVQKMTTFLDQPELRGRAVFVEDYDMVLGRYLATGVDVWLNTPQRPNEACGTSGMKVLANGGLNVSVPDGWWDEAIHPGHSGESSATDLQAGWVVGSREPGTVEEMNRRDAASLMDILEYEVIPEFYDHDEDGIPHRWVARVKESMAQLTPRFSATRMMHDYIKTAYLPAARAFSHRSAASAKAASEILAWNDRVRTHWDHVRIGQVRVCNCEGRQTVNVECWLDDLLPDDVRVELYAESMSGCGPPTIVPLRRSGELPGAVNGFDFAGEVNGDRSIDDFTVRIVPHHQDAFIPSENQCILWAK